MWLWIIGAIAVIWPVVLVISIGRGVDSRLDDLRLWSNRNLADLIKLASESYKLKKELLEIIEQKIAEHKREAYAIIRINREDAMYQEELVAAIWAETVGFIENLPVDSSSYSEKYERKLKKCWGIRPNWYVDTRKKPELVRG